MKNLLLLMFLVVGSNKKVVAQKYFTKNGNISFFSQSTLENIRADNNQVMSVINTNTGDLQFSVMMKNFHFKKALMEEHFNENYVESDQYPKATFKGKISDISKVNFTKDGAYAVTATGDLNIHGITKTVSIPGTITVSSGLITGTSKFTVAVADYNISIPKLVESNISKTIEITVNCRYNQKM